MAINLPTRFDLARRISQPGPITQSPIIRRAIARGKWRVVADQLDSRLLTPATPEQLPAAPAPNPIPSEFPFDIPVAQQWNESTYIYIAGGLQVPSSSSETYIPAFGQGTLHPVGFTLEEVTELYWRIAAWQVTMQVFDTYNPNNGRATINAAWAETSGHHYNYSGVTFDEHNVPPDFWTIIDSPEITYTGNSYYNGTNESGLNTYDPRSLDISLNFTDAQSPPVLPPYEPPATTTFQPVGTQTISDSIPDLMSLNNLVIERTSSPTVPLFFDAPQLNVNMFKNLGTLHTVPAMIQDEGTGLYYPQISFDFYPTGYVDTKALRSFRMGDEELFPMTNVGATVNVLGKSINLYRADSGPALETITVTPKYWWPYDLNDGNGPRYDVNTGEQI